MLSKLPRQDVVARLRRLPAARLTLGLKGRRAAWFAVAALPIVVFSLIGVPIVYEWM